MLFHLQIIQYWTQKAQMIKSDLSFQEELYPSNRESTETTLYIDERS